MFVSLSITHTFLLCLCVWCQVRTLQCTWYLVYTTQHDTSGTAIKELVKSRPIIKGLGIEINLKKGSNSYRRGIFLKLGFTNPLLTIILKFEYYREYVYIACSIQWLNQLLVRSFIVTSNLSLKLALSTYFPYSIAGSP